ncbi:MAG: rhomboid family intramembrane serine protease [Chloroflexota bacterium]|nr:rhomboid family intramembrane serine protease [Chloroflexota bacterium]
MIPLSDVSRRPCSFPIINVLLITANVVVFTLELALGDAFINRWVFVPAHLVAGRDWITVVTAMFMHGGWLHIGGNMLFLWVFGPEIEDVMGPVRYLLFYLLGGIISTVAQVTADPTSVIPNLGASGAIAAVMGAFLITYPRDQIRTVLFIGWFVRITFVPAVLLVGLWILVQVVSQVGVVTQDDVGGGVAYMAHIGGFVFGAITARLFEVRGPRNCPASDF